MIFAAFKPSLQPLAFGVGFVSMLSFLVLAFTSGPYNEAIRKVVVAR